MLFSNNFTFPPIELTRYLEPNARLTRQQAIDILTSFQSEFDKNSPRYSNSVIVSPKIKLLMPGKYWSTCPGDYLLLWNGKPPTHQDICDALIRMCMKRERRG